MLLRYSARIGARIGAWPPSDLSAPLGQETKHGRGFSAAITASMPQAIAIAVATFFAAFVLWAVIRDLVERQTRYVTLAKVAANKDTQTVVSALIKQAKTIPNELSAFSASRLALASARCAFIRSR